MKNNINNYNWIEIQKEHINGLTLSAITKKYKMSRTLLKNAINNNLLKKYDIKHKFTDDEKLLMSIKRKKYLKLHPELHPWKNKHKFKSIPCEKLKELLNNNNISYVEEYQPLKNRFFSIDIAFPDKKIGLEINGNQHYNSDGTLKEYYQNRHNLIESDGWKIYEIHYSLIYKYEFIDLIINKLKTDYDLTNIDYSFYVKIKKNKKYSNRKEYFKDKQQKYDKEQEQYIEFVIKSDIDFSKFGWVGKVAIIINQKSQKVNQWMKKYMSDFYNQNCFKRNKQI